MVSPRVVAALALCLTLAACADYRTADLKRDVIPAEQIARDYRLDPEWWTAYGDADLDALMRTALARNVNLARSAVAVNRALYNARLIGADLLPVFSADASAGSDKNLASGDAGRSYQSRLGVSYELDLWQRLRNAASAQEWEYLATREDLEAARLAHIEIPTLCFLKEINEIGACRICVVEVKGAKSLVASCVYPINDGMEVWTNTPRVQSP